jgi:hypothetical protein
MFKPDLSGKYIHPWLKPLPAGRARAYDLGYKGVSTLLFAAATYGLFELGRCCYHIASANRQAAPPPGAEAEAGRQQQVCVAQFWAYGVGCGAVSALL